MLASIVLGLATVPNADVTKLIDRSWRRGMTEVHDFPHQPAQYST
jgi:hypothetical protein